MSMSRVISGILSVSLLALGTGVASGQTFPNKPVRFLAAEAGGGTDFAARLIAQEISGPLGQPVIIQNANAFIGTERTVRAQPDGHTLLFTGAALWLLPFMQDNVPWDPVKDFLPVTMTTAATNILVVHPALPVKSAKDLIALAKAKPGVLNYSAGARGSAVHLAAELFNAMAGVKIVGIAYKSTAPALTALMGNEVQVSFPTATSVGPLLKSGKLRGLAVTSAQPSVLFPDLPTVAASGLPGYEMTNPTGIFAPAKTPATVIRQLNQEIVRALNVAAVKERFLSIGVEIVGSSPEQFAATIKTEMARMSKVIKDAGIRAE